MRYLLAAYFWTISIIITASFLMFCIAIRLGALLTFSKRYDIPMHLIAIWWGQTMMAVVPGWQITIYGKENLPKKNQATVMVCNHESMTDILAASALGVQFRWLAKSTAFKIPMLGIAMKWAGYVPIVRGDKRSHVDALVKSAEWLQKGVSMFFFPEGTRTDDGEVREFKIGAFKLAEENHVPIIPMAIKGARELMAKGSGFPASSHVKVRVLPAVTRNSGETIEQFAARVRGMVVEAKKSIDV